MANANLARAGVDDRVTVHCKDAASADVDGQYDLVAACECIHDMSNPVGVLRTMRRLAKPDGTVLVMDDRVADEFGNFGDPVERLLYGASLFVCLPDGMAHQPSAATGTVMRPSTLRGYALEAGYSDLEVLPLEHDLFRFYRLVP
jgi:SAM-dependent methyltransferase